ncbi:MAG TPA: pseudouridine synthase, partial [Asticcacaulis sp.]|nr:pseudouridine synthase [Asticcacaulis sp.]
MRDAKDALGKKPERPKKAPKKDDKLGTGERIAKVLARAGLASRREIERLIGLGKIAVNGRILETPAVLVKATDIITVDGQVVGKAEPTRLWRYHKPVGLVTTERDPSGRPTVFDKLPADLPRVLKVGRLDLNSEGLLLLTNDGELARALELPSAGWVRRYRARALGHTTQVRLDALKDGTTVEGVIYGPMEATLDKLAEKADGRANVWITVSITEGKNREVRKVLESIGLKVNRLIRLAYGPFQLGNLEPGEVEEIGPRVIRELLGEVIQLRNLPPEGASQTRSAPMQRLSSEGGTPAGRRGGGDRFEKKGFGDKPAFGAKKFGDKKFGDKKFGDKAGEWKPRTEFEKRDFKERDFDERPRFEGDGEARDRRPSPEGEFKPRRDFGDKKPFGDKPKEWKPRVEGAERKSYGDRLKRDFGDRPQGDRPAFKKPYAARDNAGGERS